MSTSFLQDGAGSAWVRFATLLLLLLAVSFAPSSVKNSLCTRGPFHSIAHISVFALLCCLVPLGSDTRLWTGAALVLLGCLIEGAEVHGCWRDMELRDMAADAFGVVLGALLPAGRAAARCFAERCGTFRANYSSGVQMGKG